MTAVWIILAVLCALFAALGFFLADYSMKIRRQTLEQARQWQSEHYDISWYDTIKKQDYTVKSYDGYVLHAQKIFNSQPTDRYVLISHGYTDNHIGSLKYTRMYLDLGFNVILYDLRGHGENEPTFCTYSIRERRDLETLICDSRARYPEAKLFGIHGESLGSATSIAVLEYKPPIDFVVADCGFSEITTVMQGGLRGMHLPAWLVHWASVCAKVRFGYYYHQMRPIDSLKDNQIPILFIHGDKDDFIIPAHSQKMQQATKGYSEIHLIPGATHAASILTAPEDYKRYVREFLQKIGK